MFDFIEFGIKDIIDIVLVAMLLYYVYRLMKESRSLNVFIGIIIFVIMWLIVSQIIQMTLRRFLSLGRNNASNTGVDKKMMMAVVMSCMNMSRRREGALIVIERNIPLDEIVQTGEMIDAQVNQRLIENIFFKNSPLHDGAMIISDQRIKAAGCILPVSHNLDIPKELGLRHRAAMGVSQESDALAVVVSEETGSISVAVKGEFRLRLTAEALESILDQELAR